MALPLQLEHLTRGGVGGHGAQTLWPFYFAPDAGDYSLVYPHYIGFYIWGHAVLADYKDFSITTGRSHV